MTLRLWGLGVAVCLGGSAGANALGTIKRVLADPFGVSVHAVQTRMDFGGSRSSTISLDIVKDVGAKIEVLSPSESAGLIAIDDGKQYLSHAPGKRVLTAQMSPVSYRQPINDRIKLINENYKVTLGRSAEWAGRKAVWIILKPRFGELPTRKMLVDKKEDFILRYDVEAQNAVTRIVDTISVEFSPRLGAEVLHFPAGTPTTKRLSWAPRKVGDLKIASAITGITPDLPAVMPYGFRVYTQHLVGSESNPMYAFRLSDGVSRVTVYEWNPRVTSEKSVSGMKIYAQDREGNRYYAWGDVSQNVLEKLCVAVASGSSAQVGNALGNPEAVRTSYQVYEKLSLARQNPFWICE